MPLGIPREIAIETFDRSKIARGTFRVSRETASLAIPRARAHTCETISICIGTRINRSIRADRRRDFVARARVLRIFVRRCIRNGNRSL